MIQRYLVNNKMVLIGPYLVTTSKPPQAVIWSWLDGRFFQFLARPSQPGWRADTFLYEQSCYLLSLTMITDSIRKMVSRQLIQLHRPFLLHEVS